MNNKFYHGKATVDIGYEIKGMDAKTKALMGGQIMAELNASKNVFKKNH